LTYILIGSLAGILIDSDHFFILLRTNFTEVIERIRTLDVLGLYHSMATCESSFVKYFAWHSLTILVFCVLALSLAHGDYISYKLSGLVILILILHFVTDFGKFLL